MGAFMPGQKDLCVGGEVDPVCGILPLRKGRVLEAEPFPGVRPDRLHLGLELLPADFRLFLDALLRVAVASVREHEDVGSLGRKQQHRRCPEAFVIRVRRDYRNPVVVLKNNSLSHHDLQQCVIGKTRF